MDRTEGELREALDREAASAANRREAATRKAEELRRDTIEGEGDLYPTRNPGEERHLEVHIVDSIKRTSTFMPKYYI